MSTPQAPIPSTSTSTSAPHAAAPSSSNDDGEQLAISVAAGSSETDTEKTPAVAALPEQDVAPDGGYGWVVVACVFMINAHTWGINSVCHSPSPSSLPQKPHYKTNKLTPHQSYGVFLSYYLQHGFFPGASPLDYAFVGGLSIAMSQVVSPPATLLIRPVSYTHLTLPTICSV